MADLITLEMAKRHLGLDLDSGVDDANVLLKIAQAQAAVLDYIDQRLGSPGPVWSATIEAWDEDTTTREFYVVQAAILKQFGGLYRDRGDDDAKGAQDWVDGLAPNVARMLTRLRDPAIA
jgi:hypothetical protein